MSLIFPKGKIFFLHIPKTAGTSFREVLKSEYPAEGLEFLYKGELDLCRPDLDYLNNLNSRLPYVKAFYGHFSFGAHHFSDINDFSYVAILRKPVDRIVSLYNHFANDSASKYHGLIQEGMSLADFVASRVTAETNNHMTRIISGIPPINGVSVDELKYLEMALENIEKYFCFVGLSERIQESTDRVGRLLGWGRHLVPMENITTVKIAKGIELDRDTLSVVNEHNYLDVLLYEHVRNIFDKDWRFKYGLVADMVKWFISKV